MNRLKIALVALALCASAPAQRYTSKPHGFSMIKPRGYREIPIRASEQWILAKFQSERMYIWNDPKGMTTEHRPLMQVLSFPKNIKFVETEKVGDTTTKTMKIPYRNYRDYLKRHYKGGGWYISKEETLKVKDREIEYLEINIDKLSNQPKHILVAVYDEEDREVAVEVDILKNQYTKQRKGLQRVLRSLKFFEAEISAEQQTKRGDAPTVFTSTGGDVDFDKRWRERKRAWKRRVLEESTKNLPQGWKIVDTKNYLVLTHSSPRYTKRVIKQAKAVRKWLEKNFGDVGEGKVMKSIIRICADVDEERAYIQGSGDSYSSESGEVICSGAQSAFSDGQFLVYALTRQYLDDKNPALWRALPDWINIGLGSLVRNTRMSKNKGFEFTLDFDALKRARIMAKDGRFPSLRDTLTQAAPERVDGNQLREEYQDYRAIVSLFVRYSILGPGRRGKTKDIVQTYLRKAVEILDEMDQDEFKKAFNRTIKTKEAMTEEEEEEQWKKRRERAKGWDKERKAERAKLFKDAHDAAFGNLEVKDWIKLDKSFKRWVVSKGKK